jgi:hypothetical protein
VHGACDERFRPILERMGSRALEASEEVIYGVWKDLTLAYTNPSWARFAMANDGNGLFLEWGLGRSILEACGPELQPFYERALRRVLDTGQPFVHEYACHAPAVRRWHVMRVLPVADEALLISNALVAAVPNDDDDAAPLLDADYRAADGWVQQCPHCRRVRAVASSTPNRWDFAPRLLERHRAASVTHALCPLCFAYHYQDQFTRDELRAIVDELMNRPKGRL